MMILAGDLILKTLKDYGMEEIAHKRFLNDSLPEKHKEV